MSMANSRDFDIGRKSGEGFSVSARPEPSEQCGTCVWGDAGCLEGKCLRKAKGCHVEPRPVVDPPPASVVTELMAPVAAAANETLLRNLANRKATLLPQAKTLEGSTPLIHARRRVVQAVLGLAHFEVRNPTDRLHDRKADLEMAMIEWENEILRRAGVVVKPERNPT